MTNPQAVRAAIGVTGQFSAVDWLLTAEENLLLMADLRHLVSGGHISLQFTSPHALDHAARVLGEVSRDTEAMTLQVPSDGGVQSLRTLLDRLDTNGIHVEGLTVHTPDLDDVFLALTGLITLLAFALTWLAVALGTLSRNPEGVSSLALPVALLPFIGSTFVPTESMSAGVRWFSENQPFTPIGNDGLLAVAWCIVISMGGYLWAKRLFNRQA